VTLSYIYETVVVTVAQFFNIDSVINFCESNVCCCCKDTI